ncbi:MAG: hypothetical protein ABIJ23_04745 [Candidatus Magasanikbacteria bacterium]
MDGIGEIINKQTDKKPKQNKNIHSEAHYWADIISTAFGERHMFGMYLGVIKRIGADKAQQIFAEIQESNIKDPGKLFMWKSSPKNLMNKKEDQKK